MINNFSDHQALIAPHPNHFFLDELIGAVNCICRRLSAQTSQAMLATTSKLKFDARKLLFGTLGETNATDTEAVILMDLVHAPSQRLDRW